MFVFVIVVSTIISLLILSRLTDAKLKELVLEGATSVFLLTHLTDHQNIHKVLISNSGVECVHSKILRALDSDIHLLLQKGLLTFQTLERLDRKKPEEYNVAGVYIHVIYELEQPSVYKLCVGASMNVKSRVTEHRRFGTTPSRACLHYRIWIYEGQGNIFLLLRGFSNVDDPKQYQVAMNNLSEEFGCLVFQALPNLYFKEAFETT